jgi:predicted choloylglycine hydrolase
MSVQSKTASLRRRVTLAALVSQLLAFLSGAVPLDAAERSSASRPSKGAVSTIELRGDPATIGREYGRQCAKTIRLLHEQYIREWFGDEQRYRQALQVASQFREFLPPEYHAEIDALAAAADMTPDAVLLANSFLDFAAGSGCSTVALPAVAAPDGVARFGRNLDFPSLNVADKHSIVLVVHPKDRYAFAAVTWPGMLGVLSGMNEHGLTLANMEVSRKPLPPRAMPYIYLYRTILERCRTVDEAVALLRKTPPQSANNLMLMDAAGNRAVVEITPEKVVVRSGSPLAALVSTNHQRGQDADKTGLCSRYDRLHSESARQFGRIGVPAIERMLAQTASDITLQSMIFEPANRAIWLALGANAPGRGYAKVKLSTYFP